MSERGSNLARVLTIWGDLARSGSMAPLIDAIAEDAVLRGLRPDLVCHGRDEIAGVLASTGAGTPGASNAHGGRRVWRPGGAHGRGS